MLPGAAFHFTPLGRALKRGAADHAKMTVHFLLALNT
jgi:hypothetical protein